MTSVQSHDGGSSNQNTLFDYSRNETSYGNYTNIGQHGVINNVSHQTTNYQSTQPLGMLAFRSSSNDFKQ